MDRQIVYPGQIPLETDLLNTNKFAMTGLAKLASAILGEKTCLYGLACKPTAPASMSVQVGEAQIIPCSMLMARRIRHWLQTTQTSFSSR